MGACRWVYDGEVPLGKFMVPGCWNRALNGVWPPQVGGDGNEDYCPHDTFKSVEHCRTCEAEAILALTPPVASPTPLKGAWVVSWGGPMPNPMPIAPELDVAQAVRGALLNIRELNMSGEDENGQRWANSDLIEQEIVAAICALLPEGDAE